MAEIRVKLLADAAQLLKDSQDAARRIEGIQPVIEIKADTGEFMAGIKRAIEEAEKLQPIMQITAGSQHGSSSAGVQPQPLRSSEKPGTQNDPNKTLSDLIRNSQAQEVKNSQALLKALTELTRIIEKSDQRKGSGNNKNENNNDNNPTESSWKDMFLRYLNINPTGEKGSVQPQDIVGNPMNGRGGLMGMLSAVPGLGMLSSFMSAAGAIQKTFELIGRDAEQNKEAREKAADTLADTYDVFGSVRAYSPEEYGQEGYTTGTYITSRQGQEYGYDLNTTLSASDTLISKSGFTDTASFQQDLTSVLAASRATGVDTSTMANLAGTARQVGYQQNGDQGKILSLLGRQIEVSGMQGREDEMVEVLQSILDELGTVSSTVSEQAVGDKLNLMNILAANNSDLNGNRAKNAIESLEDYTSSDDMSVLIAAGYGTEFKGKEGLLQLREMQETNPTAFMERVIKGFAERGMDETDILFQLKEAGAGSVSQNREIVQAVLSGQTLSADMTDQAANRVYGQNYLNGLNAQYEQTISPYSQYQIAQSTGDFVNGSQQLPQYRAEMERVNNLDAQGLQSEDWRVRNSLGQWWTDFGRYDLGQGGASQMADMESAYRSAVAGNRNTGSLHVSAGYPSASAHPDYSANTALSAEPETAAAELPGVNRPAAGGSRTASVQSAYSSPNLQSASVPGFGFAVISAMDASAVQTAAPPSLDMSAQQETLPAETVPLHNDIAAMIAAGYGTEYTGKEGLLELQRMQIEAPETFAQRVIEGTKARGMSDNSAAFMTTESGITSLSASTVPTYADYAEQAYPLTEYAYTDHEQPHTVWMDLSGRGFSGGSGRLPEQSDSQSKDGFGESLRPVVPFTPTFFEDIQNNWAYRANEAKEAWGKIFPQSSSLMQNSVEEGEQVKGESSPDALREFFHHGASKFETSADSDYLAALQKNTEELKENTKALSGLTTDNTADYVTGAQRQAGLLNNGAMDTLSNSVSIESPMTRLVASNPQMAKAVSNIVGSVGSVVQSLTDSLTGTQTISSEDSPTVVHGTDGSLTVSGTLEEATPHAVGNDYVPYDGYLASLHKGEMVLPKHDAELFRQGRLENTADMRMGSAADETTIALLNEAGPDAAFPASAFAPSFSQDQMISPEPQHTIAFQGGDINININVTGQVEGLNPDMQRQMVDSIQAQIAGAGLRDFVSNGFTRRQNW